MTTSQNSMHTLVHHNRKRNKTSVRRENSSILRKIFGQTSSNTYKTKLRIPQTINATTNTDNKNNTQHLCQSIIEMYAFYFFKIWVKKHLFLLRSQDFIFFRFCMFCSFCVCACACVCACVRVCV